MRILIVNTSETAGGAAIAASRLTEALNRHGVKAEMLVRDKHTDRITTATAGHALCYRWAFIWERARIWLANRLSRKGLWRVDIANAGVDITATEEFRKADVVHLHWVNQGMLSLRQIGKILDSGKRVVWTMHDMWPCTAICHHAGQCDRYHTHCHTCPQLQHPASRDMSYSVFARKLQLYSRHHITFVACSQWLQAEAMKSRLLQGQCVVAIPNTYNAAIFHPSDQLAARRRHHLPEQGRLLLFACQKVTNPQKGLQLLIDALQLVQDSDVALVVVGQMAESVATSLTHPVHRIGYINSQSDMAALYCAVDAFVTPSLEENLPNTIMEAMACGTPCVGFATGGIPEMIAHQQNGYVAAYRDAEDLARGISYVLDDDNRQRLSQAAAAAATAQWNEQRVTQQYIKVYEQSY